jgi:hypothetical protein
LGSKGPAKIEGHLVGFLHVPSSIWPLWLPKEEAFFSSESAKYLCAVAMNNTQVSVLPDK